METGYKFCANFQNEFVVSTDNGGEAENDHYESFNLDDSFDSVSDEESAADAATGNGDEDEEEEVADWVCHQHGPPTVLNNSCVTDVAVTAAST